MRLLLTRVQIGKKLADIRKKRSLSQEELAKMIGVSRPVMVQIEAGKRGLEVTEFLQIANLMEFSIDEFLSNSYSNQQELSLVNEVDFLVLKKERIPEPILKMQKLQNVLLYLLEKTAGKANAGESFISRLLYFADFNFYELYEEHLSGMSYKKQSFGPYPIELIQVLDKMIEDGAIKKVKTKFQGSFISRFIPLEQSNLHYLKASEKEVIDHVIEQMGNWTTNKINEYAKKDMPYLATKEGDVISFEMAFYRESPFTVRYYKEDEEHEY
jgi:transcriptional regulator with XRE-family HTH domain